MKTISQDKPFSSDTLEGANNKLYALVNTREKTDEDGNTQYLADGILIDNVSQKDEAIKQYKLNSIVSNSFYADNISRMDLLTPIVLLLAQTLDRDALLPVPFWKTTDGKKEEVTIGEFLDAIQDGLAQKGEIVGEE